MNVLITRPEHDTATFYLSKWSEPLIKKCKNKGFRVFDLKGSKANIERFNSIVSSKKPSFLILNGHGTKNAIFGQDNKQLLSMKNLDLPGKPIIYSVACETASGLGKDAVNNGVQAYIGYSQKFIFIADQNKASRPTKDELAKPFFESTNRVPEGIIKGNTAQRAFEKAKSEFKKQMIRLRKEAKTFEEELVLKYLLWDFMFLSLLGKAEARL